MLTSLKLWNEPNNLSHWDFELDPDWSIYASMVRRTSRAIRRTRPDLPLVLGGLSPVDPRFLRHMEEDGVLDAVDVLAIHGFPYDWTLWPLEAWPERVAALRREFGMPVWITEAGVSSFASERMAAWGLRRSREVLRGERVYWYSLLDLAPECEATTRHKEAGGASYFRHFHFGLLRHDGTPKAAVEAFGPELGICQWFHFRDERTLDLAATWLARLGVREVRTGLSWAESHRDGGWDWFDRIMEALEPFRVCVTLCFTPDACGLRPHHTSPPEDVSAFVRFAERVVERYAPAGRGVPAPGDVPPGGDGARLPAGDASLAGAAIPGEGP